MSGCPNPLSAEEAAAIEAAALWFVRSREGLSRDDRGRLRAWLREAPEHVAAMDIVSRGWEVSEEAARHAGPELQRALKARLSRRSAARRRWAALWPAGAVMAASLALGAGFVWKSLSFEAVYAAPRGQQMTLALADGSQLRLDAGSRLAVRFTPTRRRVELLSGEAEFRVAHDRWRPFRVDAGPIEVWDRGTTFTARSRDAAVRVILEQGAVELHDRVSGRLRATLAPGQQATLTAHGAMQVGPDLMATLAWREGQLVLDDVALSEVLTEFRDRTPVEITLADERLGDLRISGVYRIADPVGFLNALGALYPVRWHEVAPGRFQLWRARG